jgi:hypothetical protein
MADNFDLRKFLKENKTMERSNPYLTRELNEETNKESLRLKIREMIEDELEEGNYYEEPVAEAKKDEEETEETEEEEVEIEEPAEEAPSGDPRAELKDLLDQAVAVAKEIDGELAIQIDNDIKYLDKIEGRELRSGGSVEEPAFDEVDIASDTEFEEEEIEA